MKVKLLRAIAFLLTISFLSGLVPMISLAADNELVLTRIGHNSTDSVGINDTSTRAVTLAVPYLYSGSTVDLSDGGLRIEKASAIGAVVTSFESGSTAIVGTPGSPGPAVEMTVKYYKGADTAVQHTTQYSISIVRTAHKDPAFAGTISKSFTGVMPNAAVNDITFSVNDFASLYKANDGGTLSSISISGSNLACGWLKISTGTNTYINYNAGDKIDIADIGKLVFDAVDSGSVSYLVGAYTGNASSKAIGSVLLNIDVKNIAVPTLNTNNNLTKSVSTGSAVTFTMSDFSSLCNLNGGTVKSIEITPSNNGFGVWSNGSSQFTTATVFTTATINKLTFTGSAAGNATFTWKISNEAGFSLPGSGTITVKPVTVPTITAGVSKSVAVGSVYTFSMSDFSSCYNLNNGTFASIVISPANNSYGTWYKGSNPFSSATSFTANEIASLQFKGTHAGQAAFTWTVSNEKGASPAGSGSITVNTAASPINYTTAQNTVKTFSSSDFNTACSNATSSGLNYIYFPSAPSSGTLYYGYTSPSSPGTAVSLNSAFYYNGLPDISYITFVPASNFTGTVSIPYNAYNVSGASYSGTVQITVGSSGNVSYTTNKNTAKAFSAADFSAAFSNATGQKLSYIILNLPTSTYGTLYKNYTSSSKPGTPVTSGTAFYANASPSISSVTFMPASHYTGTVTLSYTGFSTSGTQYQGAVVIKITGPASDISFTLINNQTIKFSSAELNTVCNGATGAHLKYITFILPYATYGKLYYNYTSSSSTGTAVAAGTAYYNGAAPAIDNVTFVPASTYTGNVIITYTGYNENGVSYTGRFNIQIEKSTGSVHFTDVGQSYVWAAGAIDFLFEAGVVKGVGGTLYNPSANITRGDFILMLYNAMHFSGSKSSNFPDVPKGSYYYDAIAVAKSLGIAQGYNNKFNPTASLTRQDAMLLIYNALLVTGESLSAGSISDLSSFTDKGNISGYALAAVETLVKAKIITGSYSKINPTGNLSRAEMALILYKVKTTF